MNFKTILDEFNILKRCRQYHIPIRQCPQFWFLTMGFVISITSVVTYILGTRYVADPQLVALIVFILTVVLFVLTFSVTRSLEGLAEANRLKTEFINIVSHQLGSPLSNLKWTIEVLLSNRLGRMEGKQLEYFKILQENSSRMQELVSDLLMVSKIRDGQLPLQTTEFSLADLTKELITRQLSTMEDSNVTIELEAADVLPKVFADRARIRMVIENLLDNAVRYIRGQGKVKIKIISRKKNLLFEIKDTGVGIPGADQKHIFQKFFRSQNALRHQTRGSGLGLYIAKFIIEKSGGQIWFHSAENKGSTFCFTLSTK